MEGQQFNSMAGPAPQPEPQPQPQPQPNIETAQPAPQDNFAEPMQASAGWQPTQATAPQVGGMNIPPALTATAPEPKKGNMGVVIGIVIGLLVIVGAIIAVAVMLASNSGDTGKTNDNGNTSETGKTEDKKDDEKMAARDDLRETTLKFIIMATKDYATNHDGRTPFGINYNQAVLGYFVNRYIDEGISQDGAVEGKSFPCNKSSCVQFSDADQTTLGWTIDVAVSGKTNEKISYHYEGKPDHIIHVYVRAKCGEEEGTYTTSTTNSQFAMFYFMEGDKVLCGDSEKGIVNGSRASSSSKSSVNMRNTQREDDIARFLTAVNDYQTNNRGKTPFGTASAIATDYSQFVKRYIDENVSQAKNGTTSCASGKTCPQFTDPDGTLYQFRAMTEAELVSLIKTKKTVDHVMYVAINAGCDHSSGSLSSGTSDRQVAIMYVGEGEKVFCNDNH